MSTLLDWQLIALDAIFVDGRIVLPPVPDPPPAPGPVPVGTLFLGDTALAVDDAVQRTGHRRHASRGAAIATAAHDVLAHYLPNTQTKLDDALETTLVAVPHSRAERRGVRDPLVLPRHVPADGPPALTSAEWVRTSTR